MWSGFKPSSIQGSQKKGEERDWVMVEEEGARGQGLVAGVRPAFGGQHAFTPG